MREMENTEGKTAQRKGSPRPQCPNCRQVLSNRLFDYCLWCGAVLPEELHLSDSDKAAITESRKNKLASIDAERASRDDAVQSRSLLGI